MPKPLIAGGWLIALIAAIAGLVYFSDKMINDIQDNAEWEVHLMRLFWIVSLFVLVSASAYQALRMEADSQHQ